MIDYRVRALYYIHMKKEYTNKLVVKDREAHNYALDVVFQVLKDIGGDSQGNLTYVDGKEVTNIIVKDLIYDPNLD